MPVVRGEVEIAGADKLVANTAHHLSVIAVAQLRNKDADRKRAPVAQRTRQQVGLIVHRTGSSLNPVPGNLRNSPPRYIVEDHRYGRRIQTKMRRQLLQADWLRISGFCRLDVPLTAFSACHLCASLPPVRDPMHRKSILHGETLESAPCSPQMHGGIAGAASTRTYGCLLRSRLNATPSAHTI